MSPISVHFFQAWTRHQPSRSAKRMAAKLLVIRIEEIGIARVERNIILRVFGKNKSFKKPGGMREVPLHWTCLRHGLQHLVFGRKRRRQPHTEIADRRKPLAKNTRHANRFLFKAHRHALLLLSFGTSAHKPMLYRPNGEKHLTMMSGNVGP